MIANVPGGAGPARPGVLASVAVSARDGSVDVVRGLAITGIAFGHVLRGVRSAGLLDGGSPAYLAADRAVYMVHVALFAAAAGLMVRGSLVKRGPARYLRERLGDFAWVYVIWSIVQGLMQYALAGSVNSERTLGSVFALWLPANQMWFLPWIMVMTVLVVAAQPWRSRARAVLSVLAAAALSIGCWGLFGPFIGLEGLGLSVFFFATATLTLTGYSRLRERLGTWGVLLVLVCSAAVYALILVLGHPSAPTTTQFGRTPASTSEGFLCAWAGVIAVTALAVLLDRVPPLSRLLGYLGRQSMVIFLAHTLALAAARIALMRLGVDSVAVHLVLGTIIALAGSLVLWWATRRWLPWIWHAPRAVTG